MRIALICPAEDRDRITHPGQKPSESRILRTNRISLLAVAAATPEGHELEYVDEHVEPVDYGAAYDAVGISFMTGLAPRAYAIGDKFRRRGIPVIFGGYHSSFLPQEALQHCDAVCLGEAEPVWSLMLKDASENKLKPFYRAQSRLDLSQLRPLRRDLLKREQYFTTNLVLVGRGCPFSCDFCSVTQFFEQTYRFRPVEDILREVAALEGRLVLFGDDNIVADPAFAKTLFKALKPLKKKWMSQANLTLAQDPELLRLAAQSGCAGIFAGFESLANQNLREQGKGFYDARQYRDLIARLNDHGIAVMGGFIFGFDNDDATVFEQTVHFIRQAHFAAVQVAILTPFPGTPLYTRLKGQGRILDHDWSKYDFRHVVFRPKQMSPEALAEGTAWAIRELYSHSSICARLLHLLGTWGPIDTMRYALPLNLGYRWDLRN